MRVVAFICRYGHQDFFRVTGRDPIGHPLTALEAHIFASCLKEHLEVEFSPRQELGLPTND
jgi:hypothetical protein